jgi:hypothetical protein
MTKTNSTLTLSLIAGGMAILAGIFAFAPASQADANWRARPTQPRVTLTFDQGAGVVRFYAGAKEVAILNGSGVHESHPSGR